MDREKIEHLITLDYTFPRDNYRDGLVALLTPPAWYHPLRRRRFYQTLDRRLAIVMAEYAGDLVNALTGGKTQTTYKPTHPVETTLTPTQGAPAVTAQYPKGFRTDI